MLLAPAVSIMSRLRYQQKFALITVLFLLPLAVVTYFFHSEVSAAIAFSRKELDGTRYQRGLIGLQERIVSHQLAAWMPASSKPPVDEALQILGRLEGELGSRFTTAQRHSVIADGVRRLSDDGSERGRVYDEVVARIRDQIVHVGNESNLILDPDLDSYYLMDVIVQRLPETIDITRQLAVAAVRVGRSRGVVSVEEKAEFIRLASLLESNLGAVNNGMSTALRKNPGGTLYLSLSGPWNQYAGALGALLRVIEEDVIPPGRMEVSGERVIPHAVQLFAVSGDLWQRSATELDRLLQSRVDMLAERRAFVMTGTVLTLIVVGYLLTAFYVSVTRTVASLETTTRRMLAGHMDDRFAVEARDELGRLAVSFNAIADRLRREWAQARDETARATAAEAAVKAHAVALQASEERNRLVVDTAHDAVVGMDGAGIITEWNAQAEATLGWAREEAVGRRLSETIVPQRMRAAHETGLRHYHASGEGPVLNTRIEIVALHRDGHEIPVELAIAPLHTERGVEFSAFIRDITARKLAAAELAQTNRDLALARDQAEEASRAKSAFLANMSHELRTPMNAIIGVSEMMLEDARELGRDQDASRLGRVLRAAEHLLAIINDILDLSKIEAGKVELHLESFDLPAVIEETAATVRAAAEKNGNRVTIDCAPGLGVMHGDATRVRQILLNLASNAVKFTERGSVSLHAARGVESGREWITIRVVDSGIGMTPEQTARLFQDFMQADASTTRRYGGTGLGLAISRRYCRLMGGDIVAESTPGAGSTFTVRLPAFVGDATAGEREAGTATQDTGPSDADGRSRKSSGAAPLVLVVDDDPTVRELMQRDLTRAGFTVALMSDGADAVVRARELRPAAITLDIMLPVVDGWSVLTALKQDPMLAGIPVILVSIVDERSRGYSLGAVEYLVKPIDRAQLIATLRGICPASARRLLVVDDDDALRTGLAQSLAAEGWTVSEATNGRVALDALESSRPDAIVLDLMMPEMDGFEFLAELRNRQAWAETPVVVVTAKDLSPAEQRNLASGVERILAKRAGGEADLLQDVGKVLAGLVSRGHGGGAP